MEFAIDLTDKKKNYKYKNKNMYLPRVGPKCNLRGPLDIFSLRKGVLVNIFLESQTRSHKSFRGIYKGFP